MERYGEREQETHGVPHWRKRLCSRLPAVEVTQVLGLDVVAAIVVCDDVCGRFRLVPQGPGRVGEVASRQLWVDDDDAVQEDEGDEGEDDVQWAHTAGEHARAWR